MHSMLRAGAFAGLLALLQPASVRAQMTGVAADRPIRIGLAGGVVVPRSGASLYELRNGAQFQGFALVRLPGGLPALRLNVDYAKLRFEPGSLAFDPSSVPGNPATADRTMLAGVASLKLDLLHGPVRPYVLAGIGAYQLKDVLTVPSTGTSSSFSDVNFGVDGGAGVALRFGRLEGFVEARLQNVYTKEQGLVDTNAVRSIPVTFGVIF